MTPPTTSEGGASSAIELDAVPRHPARASGLESSETEDPILQESRASDSAVPEGGYGWVVVVGCAIMSWWIVGTSYAWGVIQAALVENGLGSPAVLSFVGSLAAALIAALAIVNSRIMRWLGPRRTGLLSICLVALSELLSSFVTENVGGLFATSGALMGLGYSLGFAVFTVMPAQYFSRKRGLANGVVFAGGGFGGAVTSFTLDALNSRVGIAWSYRILALFTLATGLPAAWVIKERVPVRGSQFVEWRLFRSLTFLIILLASGLGTFPLFVAPFFLPIYSKSIGLSSSTGAGLVAGFNFSSAVGRILCGLLCDRVGALNVLFLSLFVSALSMLALWPESSTLAPMVVFVIVNGLSNGGFFSTMPTVVGNVFGSARVSIAMSMIVTGWAAGYLLGAPIAGYLLDAYGGEAAGLQAYRPAMFYAGSLALGSAGLVAIVRFRRNSKLFAKV